ncbi:MAG: thermonuclease family protein [Stenomitos frigidus ULC029]
MEDAKWANWTRWKSLVFKLAVLIFLTGCQPAASSHGFHAEVKQILNGREFAVAGVPTQPDLTERIRLEGIDVPDVGQQPWGPAAKAQLEKRLRHQTVRLETDAEPRDAIGRRLAYVWQGSVLLNEALVAEGYALATPHPPNSKYDQRLARAQERARVLGLGIWNVDQPMRVTPAEFRSQRRW